MPKLILRCNYLKNATPEHLLNYINYIGTRHHRLTACDRQTERPDCRHPFKDRGC